jgi:hypothetical protein
MGRTKFASPTLHLDLTKEDRDKAIQSNSGGCLIADEIHEKYPQFTRIVVDMATIRFSDPKRGVRYTYITPPSAQHVLLSFDQGWPHPSNITSLVIKRAVHIAPIVRDRKRDTAEAAARKERIAELEEKVAAGHKLTRTEKMSLSKMKSVGKKPRPERAPYNPPVEVAISVGQGSGRGKPVIYGGRRPLQGKAHPNLLRGRDRHFGAKLSDPGAAFEEAVEAAVKERLAQEDAS